MKLFILAGRHHVAETLAYHLHLPRGSWTFPASEQDLHGYDRALVIEESDTAGSHPKYFAIRAMIDANDNRFHVSPMSLDWVVGMDRRSHARPGTPTIVVDPTMAPGEWRLEAGRMP